ncbi:MAG: virulence factor [Candidatus Limnocylindrales bacterium]
MASYRVMTWRGIPSQVKATDETGASVSRMMPPFFLQEIDRVAMAEGLFGSDEYLEAWAWSDQAQRAGSAEAVAKAVADEVGEAWRRENDRS